MNVRKSEPYDDYPESHNSGNSKIRLDCISGLTAPILFKLVAIESLYLHYVIKV